MMSFLRTPRASVAVTNHESCERSSSREENDPVHSFATPTKRIKTPKTKPVRPVLHDLHKMERKADKKKRYAESALWKSRRHKEFQRNRDRKYMEPIDEPLDFSAESFNNELSSREAHDIDVTHTFMIRNDPRSVVRVKGTLYCTPHSVLHYGYTRDKVSTDDILILKSIDAGWFREDMYEVYRGDWGGLSQAIMDRCKYGSGTYTLTVK